MSGSSFVSFINRTAGACLLDVIANRALSLRLVSQ